MVDGFFRLHEKERGKNEKILNENSFAVVWKISFMLVKWFVIYIRVEYTTVFSKQTFIHKVCQGHFTLGYTHTCPSYYQICDIKEKKKD